MTDMTDDEFIKQSLKDIITLAVRIYARVKRSDAPAGKEAEMVRACGRIAGIAEKAIEDYNKLTKR